MSHTLHSLQRITKDLFPDSPVANIMKFSHNVIPNSYKRSCSIYFVLPAIFTTAITTSSSCSINGSIIVCTSSQSIKFLLQGERIPDRRCYLYEILTDLTEQISTDR